MRRNPRLDFTKREVEIPAFGVFALSGVSPSVIPSLALLGLKQALLTASDLKAAYADMTNGVMLKFREAPGAKPDPWHEAMALAIAEQQATLEAGPKAKASVVAQIAGSYVDGLRTHVATLSKEAKRALRAHPSVIQHHRRITGVVTDHTSLLALAGVMPELPFRAEPVSDEAMEAA